LLDKPDLPDQAIIAHLQAEYGLTIAQLVFLPLGADSRAAVYRARADGGHEWFIKLRRGAFSQLSVELPRWLAGQGIASVIAPRAAQAGQLWTRLGEFTLTLYPFVEGTNAYQTALSPAQWHALGQALRQVHEAELPAGLRHELPSEDFSSRWSEALAGCLARALSAAPGDATSAELARFARAHEARITDLLARAARARRAAHARQHALVLCHADFHAGNLIVTPGGDLYLVDWDEPMLAPRERDLMFVGAGGFWGQARAPAEEEALFYSGYGGPPPDPTLLAHYRYARIVEDIAVDCRHILGSGASRAERELALGYMKGNFQPGGTLETAIAADPQR
jgi:spectinomycin phosphotransferase